MPDTLVALARQFQYAMQMVDDLRQQAQSAHDYVHGLDIFSLPYQHQTVWTVTVKDDLSIAGPELEDRDLSYIMTLAEIQQIPFEGKVVLASAYQTETARSFPKTPTMTKQVRIYIDATQSQYAEYMFKTFAGRWQREKGISSSTTEIVLCPSYQHIIGMGEAALPFIFRQLRAEADKPHQWFWALESITHQNPVPRAFWGRGRAMARFWLKWAEEHGYGE